MSTAIVLLSGGMDSATLLYWALQQNYALQAVTFNYPSRPSQELKATRKIASSADVNCIEVALPFLKTAADIKKENSDAFKGVKLPEGYIPARNLIFYALAYYYAEVYGVNLIIGGHLKSDREGFPDATPTFFKEVERLVNSIKLRKEPNIQLLLPFIEKTKLDVVRIAIELGVPLELTWSCYYERDEHCGKCESCSERAEAFEKSGLKELANYSKRTR
ncbi:MAG: 7-cyano-7-deazaguanine synthase QueC [Candidatus Bathyarchaeota archaeon]|nr:MAG: 7-cyano-7-deazaguanine synthase QueC [Candidatus Bathyarchaeota archaeon]